MKKLKQGNGLKGLRNVEKVDFQLKRGVRKTVYVNGHTINDLRKLENWLLRVVRFLFEYFTLVKLYLHRILSHHHYA